MKEYLLATSFIFFAFSSGAVVRVIKIDYANSEIEVKNFATFTYSYNTFQISKNSTYVTLGSLPLVSGTLVNMPAGSTARLTKIIPPGISAGASMAIWYPNSLPSNATVSNLVDFLQYGSAGHDYESVAVAAGKWTAGDFITAAFPIVFNGGVFDYGSSFYGTASGIGELLAKHSIAVYPNPCRESVALYYDNSFGKNMPVKIEVISSAGVLSRSISESNGSGLRIETEALHQGGYILRIINNENQSKVFNIIKN